MDDVTAFIYIHGTPKYWSAWLVTKSPEIEIDEQARMNTENSR